MRKCGTEKKLNAETETEREGERMVAQQPIAEVVGAAEDKGWMLGAGCLPQQHKSVHPGNDVYAVCSSRRCSARIKMRPIKDPATLKTDRQTEVRKRKKRETHQLKQRATLI